MYQFITRYRHMAMNRKDRSCQRLFKSKLTEKYDNPLLLVTVEQNRPIIIISLASSEGQPVSNFVAVSNHPKTNCSNFIKENVNIYDYYKFNLLTSTLTLTIQLLLVPKKQKDLIIFCRFFNIKYA